MRNKNILIILMALILVAPAVYAAMPGIQAVSNIGDFLWRLLQNEYSVYLITFFLFFTLLFAIYQAALSRVKVFKSGDNISREGKIVAGALSGLSTFGIFAFTNSYGGPKEVVSGLLAPFGIYGGAALALVTFCLVYFGFQDEDKSKKWKIALAATGLSLVGFGMWLSFPNIMWIGWMIVFIALLFWIFAGGMGGEGSGKGGDKGGSKDAGKDTDKDGTDADTNENDEEKKQPVEKDSVKNFKADHLGDRVQLSWDPVDGAEYYYLIRSREISAFNPLSNKREFRAVRVTERIPAGTTTFTDMKDIKPTKEYKYKIRAYGKKFKTPWSFTYARFAGITSLILDHARNLFPAPLHFTGNEPKVEGWLPLWDIRGKYIRLRKYYEGIPAKSELIITAKPHGGAFDEVPKLKVGATDFEMKPRHNFPLEYEADVDLLIVGGEPGKTNVYAITGKVNGVERIYQVTFMVVEPSAVVEGRVIDVINTDESYKRATKGKLFNTPEDEVKGINELPLAIGSMNSEMKILIIPDTHGEVERVRSKDIHSYNEIIFGEVIESHKVYNGYFHIKDVPLRRNIIVYIPGKEGKIQMAHISNEWCRGGPGDPTEKGKPFNLHLKYMKESPVIIAYGGKKQRGWRPVIDSVNKEGKVTGHIHEDD